MRKEHTQHPNPETPTTICKCSEIEDNPWYWNAIQCATVITLLFKNHPNITKNRTGNEPIWDADAWLETAGFLTVHLGLFGIENILKGLINKYDIPTAGTRTLQMCALEKLFTRLPMNLRLDWHNEYMKLQQQRSRGHKPLPLKHIMRKYSNSYTTARTRPDKIDLSDLTLPTFLNVIEAGLTIFCSEACYCTTKPIPKQPFHK